MIQNVLQHIGGIGGFGVVSICLFFAFFIGMLLWAASLKKPYLHSMCDLPLKDEHSGQEANVQRENGLLSLNPEREPSPPALLVQGFKGPTPWIRGILFLKPSNPEQEGQPQRTGPDIKRNDESYEPRR